MPPKTRGRGGVRGRGTGRRGSAATQAAADSTAPPSQTIDTQGGTADSSEQVIVPKQEDGEDSIAAGSSLSATVEDQHGPSAEPSSPSSTPATESSVRPPRQRLDTLKSAEPSSRSASPAVRRAASSRGKKPVLLPSNAVRRSKEEREARNAADLQRERERNKERDALAAKKQKAIEAAERRNQQRASGRGRGGHSGLSSFFGGAKPDKRAAYRSTGGYGGGSGSRACRVKDEHGGSASGVKREGGGYMSLDDDDDDDDDEENAEFPRKDIDFIELSSDEQDKPGSPGAKLHGHLPIRIQRREHQERKFGINTDASVEAPANTTEQAAASSSRTTASASHKGKGKGKAKDVEITGERKPYKGVWQDSDTSTDVTVKAEPISSDDEAGNTEQVGVGGASTEIEQSSERERKPKLPSKEAPNFQTEEERAEWDRIQFNLGAMRKELGPSEEDQQTADVSGDVSMTDASAKPSNSSVRDDHAYLFQFPPIMPDLLLPGVKSEPQSGTGDTAPAAKGQPVIKKEEEFSDPGASASMGARFASGHVGKLRVHASGRTTLDWGGTSYVLGAGNPASFLQEVVALEIIPESKRVVPEDGGEAYSYGRIKEKFIVTPDFSQLLG